TGDEAQAAVQPPDIEAQVDKLFLRSWRRARRGRRIARVMFGLAASVAVVVALLIVSAPSTMGMRMPDLLWDLVIPGIGGLGLVVGLAWMWRILRADPEPGTDGWLYRSR